MEPNASLPAGVLGFSNGGLGCTRVLVVTCSLLSRLSSALAEKLGCYLGSLEFESIHKNLRHQRGVGARREMGSGRSVQLHVLHLFLTFLGCCS